MLGSSDLLTAVKKFTVDMWELMKLKLYGKDACSGPVTGWDWGQDGEFSISRNGKKGKLSHSSDVVDACTCKCTHTTVDLCVNVCGSVHCCGCVVNDNIAMAAC